jgi:hypothetical protein
MFEFRASHTKFDDDGALCPGALRWPVLSAVDLPTVIPLRCKTTNVWVDDPPTKSRLAEHFLPVQGSIGLIGTEPQ